MGSNTDGTERMGILWTQTIILKEQPETGSTSLEFTGIELAPAALCNTLLQSCTRIIEGAVASPRAGFHDFMRRGGLDGLFARHSLKPIHRVRSHFGTIGIAVARKER